MTIAIRKVHSATVRRTTSGVLIDMLSPQPEQIRAKDIIVGLSREGRFSNQTRDDAPLSSVAQHSVLAQRLAQVIYGRRVAVHALFHDFHETYTCDLIKPYQIAIGIEVGRHCNVDPDLVCQALKAIQDRFDAAIYQKAQIPYPVDPEIKRLVKKIDNVLLCLEGEANMINSEPEYHLADPELLELARGIIGSEIKPWTEGRSRIELEASLREYAPALFH